MSSKIGSFLLALVVVAAIVSGALVFNKQANAPETPPATTVTTPSDTSSDAPEAPAPQEPESSNDVVMEKTQKSAPPQKTSETPPAPEIKKEDSASSSPPPPPPTQQPTTHTITYTDTGYAPQTLTVHAGDRVTWINQSSITMWPASAMHPTHTVYPGSSIQKCGGSEASSIFDACQGISAGGTYTFTFTEKGSWKYHDHLAPRNTGSITVE